MELDSVDIKILEALQKDARLSFREISKMAGVTTPTVSGRVATMMDLGLIRGFGVDLDTDALNEVTILLNVECKPTNVAMLEERLHDMREIRELYVVDGTRLFAKVTVLDMRHLNNLLEELSQMEGITTYKYSTVTRTSKERPRAFMHEGLKLTIDCYYCRKPIVEAPVKIKMDEKDHYLCCNSCKKLYREKYERLKEAAGRIPAPHELEGDHPEPNRHGDHGNQNRGQHQGHHHNHS